MNGLKKLIFHDPDNNHRRYKSDIHRIVEIYLKNGYEISYEDAAHAWEAHSESYAAGWLCLPGEDNEVFNDTKRFFIDGNCDKSNF
jgi:hypothetical protein